MFGIDRKTEHAISRAAWEIGIAPEPVSFLSGHEILVTRFVEGFPIDTNDPATIRNVARLLHQLHSAPEVPGVFNLPSVIDDYIATAKRFNVTHPDKLSEVWNSQLKLLARWGAARKFQLHATTTCFRRIFSKAEINFTSSTGNTLAWATPTLTWEIAQSTSAWINRLYHIYGIVFGQEAEHSGDGATSSAARSI